MSVQVTRETHDTPEYVAALLERAGGKNFYGEPNYRAVWGWNRLTQIGGEWDDCDINGNFLRTVVDVRLEPKYAQLNRWHIERWCPAEMYGSPAEWAASTIEAGVLALGPYPSRGDYEHVMTLEGPQGEFIQLTPTVAEHIAKVIERSRNRNKLAGLAQKRNREERNDRNYLRWAYDVLETKEETEF